jgi:hypothetical protein
MCLFHPDMAHTHIIMAFAYYLWVDAGFWSGGSIIGFSSLSNLNSLTNRVLNKNIKIISLYIKNNKK